MKKLFTLLVAVLAGVNVIIASDIEVDGIWYDFDNENQTATVTYKGNYYYTYYNEYTGNIIIPDTVLYDERKFAVKSIASSAFYSCSGLTSITLPNTLVSIGYEAFRGCTRLTSINIPNSVTSIGNNAFESCPLTVIDNVRYADTYLVKAVNTSLSTYTIKEGTRFIGYSAFYDCVNLQAITIPNSVVSIGDYAFRGCTGLTSVTLSNSLTSIGMLAFYGCGFASITLPNTLTSIGSSAFADCKKLASITLPNSLTTIGSGAFSGCCGLTDFIIPSSVTKIEDNILSRCDGMKYIAVDPENKVYDSRDHCNAIIETATNTLLTGCASSTIPSSVTTISPNAFMYCEGLTSISIPNAVSKLDALTFSGCKNLKNISLSASVSEIHMQAFQNCPKITKITVDPDNPYFCAEDNILYNKDKTSLILFPRKSSFTEFTVPSSVTSIEFQAFAGCYDLASVTVPNTVTEINYSAFAGVRNVNYYGSATGSPWSALCLNGTTDGIFVYADASKTNLKACMTSASGVVTIPASVVNVDDRAFGGCTGITAFAVADGNTAFAAVNNALYDADTSYLVKIPEGFQGEYTVAEGMYSMNCSCMDNIQGLTKITFPASLKEFPCYEMEMGKSCTKLRMVIFKACIYSDIDRFRRSFSTNCTILQACGTRVQLPDTTVCYGDLIGGYPVYSSFEYSETYQSSLGTDSTVWRNVIVRSTIAPMYTVTPIQDDYPLGSVQFEGGSYGRYTVDGGEFQTGKTCGGLTEGRHVFVFSTENGCNNDTLLIDIPLLNFKVNGVYYSPNATGNYAMVTYRGSYWSEYSNSYSGDVVIPDSVVYNNRTYYVDAINNYAFVNCKNITSLTIKNTTPPRISDDFQFSTSTPIYVPFGSLSAYRATFRYSDKNLRVINPEHVTKETGATSATIYIGNDAEQAHIDAWGVVGGEEFSGSVIEYNGLEPNSTYADIPFFFRTIEGDSDVISVSFKTSELTLTTLESKPVSSSAAILLAQTNIADIETNCGFEYKRDNAPAGYAPTKVYCPVAEGVMAGRLKNLKDDVYYQYHAFYESASGKSFYGDWKYVFTGDQSVEFNPIVNTYKATAVREHQATLKGYALEGADDFTEQGFEYWPESRVKVNKLPARAYMSQIGEKKTVTASGIAMTVTITDLDAGTVYKYRTYAKFDDKVVYGQEMSFTTQGKWLSSTVTFIGKDGKVLSTQQVEPGNDAVAPEAPEIDGFRFIGWDKDFTNVQSDITVTAQYEEIRMVTLVVKSADETMGTVKGGGEYAEGIKVKIAAVPNKGYRFVMWNDGNTDNPRTVTVSAKTYTAVFEEEPAEQEPTNPDDPGQPDQGVETVTNDQSPITNKILRNGQIVIIRGDKEYTITGQEIR